MTKNAGKFVRGHGGFRDRDRVRVKGFRKITRIQWFYTGIAGGVHLMDEVGGFYSWNVENLVHVRRARRDEG